MKDSGLEQHDATILFEGNNGALLMANVQQPTRRICHMDIKHFALLDWVNQDLIVLEHVPTSDNIADAMTKALNKTLFYRHYDTYMGLRIPAYCAWNNHHTTFFIFLPLSFAVPQASATLMVVEKEGFLPLPIVV